MSATANTSSFTDPEHMWCWQSHSQHILQSMILLSIAHIVMVWPKWLGLCIFQQAMVVIYNSYMNSSRQWASIYDNHIKVHRFISQYNFPTTSPPLSALHTNTVYYSHIQWAVVNMLSSHFLIKKGQLFTPEHTYFKVRTTGLVFQHELLPWH